MIRCWQRDEMCEVTGRGARPVTARETPANVDRALINCSQSRSRQTLYSTASYIHRQSLWWLSHLQAVACLAANRKMLSLKDKRSEKICFSCCQITHRALGEKWSVENLKTWGETSEYLCVAKNVACTIDLVWKKCLTNIRGKKGSYRFNLWVVCESSCS